MPRVPRALAELLRRHDPAVRSLTLKLRTVVIDELAPVHEYIFPMRSKLVLLYSATPRVIADGICHIGVFTRHITLMFAAGADLPDPDSILRGTAKTMRHVPIESASEVARPALRVLLRAARSNVGAPAARGAAPTVTTRVKAGGAPPRRPARRSSNAGLRALGFFR